MPRRISALFAVSSNVQKRFTLEDLQTRMLELCFASGSNEKTPAERCRSSLSAGA